MFPPSRRQIRMLVSEAVRRVVADAVKRHGSVDAGGAGSMIAKQYPTSGFTAVEIAREIVEASKAADVVVTSTEPSSAF